MNRKSHHPLLAFVSPEGLARLRSGHPWLLKKHIKNEERWLGPLATPALLNLGEHWFFYSPQSNIVLRRFGPALRQWMFFGENKNPAVASLTIKNLADFEKHFYVEIVEMLSRLLIQKQKLMHAESCFRWVYSDADHFPGLIVDLFGDEAVVQLLSAPMEYFWPVFEKALSSSFREVYGRDAKLLLLRNNSTRVKEGLEVIPAPARESRVVKWNGLQWYMSPGGAQKTGAYLDQRENHARAAHWAQQLGHAYAWDVCSFEGGFALALAQAKLEVTAVDQSAQALATLQKNAALNNLEARVQTVEADVFDWLRQRSDEGSKISTIVLDPPSFVKNKAGVEGALRGLKELNLRALHCLEPGGLLISCTCSHHIGSMELVETIAAAGHDTRRSLKLLELRGPAADHAPLLGVPETEYLHAAFIQVQR